MITTVFEVNFEYQAKQLTTTLPIEMEHDNDLIDVQQLVEGLAKYYNISPDARVKITHTTKLYTFPGKAFTHLVVYSFIINGSVGHGNMLCHFKTLTPEIIHYLRHIIASSVQGCEADKIVIVNTLPVTL